MSFSISQIFNDDLMYNSLYQSLHPVSTPVPVPVPVPDPVPEEIIVPTNAHLFATVEGIQVISGIEDTIIEIPNLIIADNIDTAIPNNFKILNKGTYRINFSSNWLGTTTITQKIIVAICINDEHVSTNPTLTQTADIKVESLSFTSVNRIVELSPEDIISIRIVGTKTNSKVSVPFGQLVINQLK